MPLHASFYNLAHFNNADKDLWKNLFPASLEIRLDDPLKKYKPGDVISGEVIVNVKGEAVVVASELKLELVGEAVTKFQGTHRDFMRRGDLILSNVTEVTTSTLRGLEVFKAEEDLVLFQKSNRKVPPDGMKIPFSFKIPDVCLALTRIPDENVDSPNNMALAEADDARWLPSWSLEEVACVEYALGATMKAISSSSSSSSFEFEVVWSVPVEIHGRSLDLNGIAPIARRPSESKKEKELMKKCCCSVDFTKPLIFSVKAETRGACVGDRIPVIVEIFNQSHKIVKNVTAELVQVWTLELTWKVESKPVTSYHFHQVHLPNTKIRRGKKVKAGSTAVWPFQLEIPSDIPPSNTNCNTIHLEYKIKVRLIVRNCLSEDERGLDTSIDITVGSTGLKPVPVPPDSPLLEGVPSK